MTVILDPSPVIAHRFARPDADPRLGWLACGLRFAWAEPRKGQRAARCRACWG